MTFCNKSKTDYITDIDEAIRIMGEKSVITPEHLRTIGLDVNVKSLKIPRNLLNWKIVSTVERRKLVDCDTVENLILNYDLKKIYFPHDQRLEGRSLIFKNDKKWKFWKKDTTVTDKIHAWRHLDHMRTYDLSLKNITMDDKVWVVYDEKVLEECPYMLFPGVNINVLEMSKKFSCLICHTNNPFNTNSRADLEDQSNGKIKALKRKVEDGWYLFLKHPDRSRFVKVATKRELVNLKRPESSYKQMLNRQQQLKKLKPLETWSHLAEALQASLFIKVIHEKNILTDYTHCADQLYENEGNWTFLLRNFKCTDKHTVENALGNFEITTNASFHSHRNTVIAVIIKVSSEESDAAKYAKKYKK